ncbi:MAG: hypothetical protein J5647_03170 [Spirochaetaceae bacterium]|nr:hypothetical protein [Spirochaetaceae bacterium]
MFESIGNKDLRQVYNELWENEANRPAEVIPTNHSEDSFQFKINKKNDMCNEIERIFDLNIKDFSKKFKDACYSQGQEYKEISKLHSSALCSLLIFSGVSNNNELRLTLNGQECIFSSVLFEYKNKVIGFPSNVDVVLVGKNKDKTKTIILFLESKFSEYLRVSNIFDELGKRYITNEYSKEIYTDDFLRNIGIQLCKDENSKLKIFSKKRKGKMRDFYGFKPIDENDETYLEGIKQMISHYIGVEHFIEEDLEDDRKITYCAKDTEVYLGEILFDFKFKDAKEKLRKYSSYYKKLANRLKKLNPNIHVLDDILKYSLFKDLDFEIADKVKKFYGLD